MVISEVIAWHRGQIAKHEAIAAELQRVADRAGSDIEVK